MWRVVLLTIFALAVLVIGAASCFVAGIKAAEREARTNDKAGLTGATYLRRMAVLLDDMINPTDLNEFSTLNTVHRERALRLLADYNNKFRKGSS